MKKSSYRSVPPSIFGMYLKDVLLDRKNRKNYMFKVKEIVQHAGGEVIFATLDEGSKFRIVISLM